MRLMLKQLGVPKGLVTLKTNISLGGAIGGRKIGTLAALI